MIRRYVKDSVSSLQFENKKRYLYNIPVQIISDFNQDIDLTHVLSVLEKIIPSRMLNNVDIIYIADMKEFTQRGRSFNAMYKDRAIYLSPEQDNETDLLDDVVHEIAHSLEGEYQDDIYGDGDLEREFLAKRNTLHYLVDKPTLNKLYYNSSEYNAKFDNYMYNEIGYDRLRIISAGLFYSPYAITSLREYWANGFENYLLGDKERLKDLSPILYKKILKLLAE